jgi:hypothetical protein
MKRFAIVALACALAGCAATGALFDRVPEPPEGKGQVYVYRIGQVTGAVMPYRIKFDGGTEASLPQGSWHKSDLEPGSHQVAVYAAVSSPNCGVQGVQIQQNKTVYIRVEAYIDAVRTIGAVYSVGCKMEVVSAEQAAKELPGLRSAQ